MGRQETVSKQGFCIWVADHMNSRMVTFYVWDLMENHLTSPSLFDLFMSPYNNHKNSISPTRLLFDIKIFYIKLSEGTWHMVEIQELMA